MMPAASSARFDSQFPGSARLCAAVGELAETEGHHPDISFGWVTRPSR
jgi:pterin-4a-carbinolamine dehydratase